MNSWKQWLGESMAYRIFKVSVWLDNNNIAAHFSQPYAESNRPVRKHRLSDLPIEALYVHYFFIYLKYIKCNNMLL